jgi:hypothetical protein
MKKLFLTLALTATLLLPKINYAQNDNAVIAGAAALAIGGAIANIEKQKEQYELKATQHVLSSYDFNDFDLKIASLNDGVKLKDISDISIYCFKIRDNVTKKRYVLFGFISSNWVNENGIGYSKLKWELFDTQKWATMIAQYLKVASGKDDINPIDVLSWEITNTDVKTISSRTSSGKKTVFKFEKISGDRYLVADFSDKFKVLYNEKSLGLFVKETEDLVQMRRSTVQDVHSFLAKIKDLD